jgi:hypothetical protein
MRQLSQARVNHILIVSLGAIANAQCKGHRRAKKLKTAEVLKRTNAMLEKHHNGTQEIVDLYRFSYDLFIERLNR